MKIVFVTSEITPFSKTGGLADISGSLPVALEKQGVEVLVITPKYRSCKHTDAAIGKNVNVHFIERNEYFDRDNLYGDTEGDYKDNLERFAYFSRGVLEYLKRIGFHADVIHGNDWQSSLIPVYLKAWYQEEPFFKNTKTVLTIHNIAYQGIFDGGEYHKIGIGKEFFNIECLEYYGKINLLKGGIVFSDLINTVSPTHAHEIQTPVFGYGLDGVLRRYQNKLHGILNGIDYAVWNPATDPHIKKNYTRDTIADKYVNKEDLQKRCGLAVARRIPLLGIVSRLADQKGITILVEALEEVLAEQVQFILLGTGDAPYHQMLKRVQERHKQQASINLRFDAVLAQKIYAGSDMFLMPSRYEPCGLGQMISLRYGTIPIVRKTGGLVDTIEEFDPQKLAGNGFMFNRYNKDEFLDAAKRALATYQDTERWHHLMKHAMEHDFSWEHSAGEYVKLYEQVCGQ
jgi:starch synthase